MLTAVRTRDWADPVKVERGKDQPALKTDLSYPSHLAVEHLPGIQVQSLTDAEKGSQCDRRCKGLQPEIPSEALTVLA